MKINSKTLLLLFIFCASSLHAQTIFTVATANGYAEGTTGGGDATPVTVTTTLDFQTAVSSAAPAVIIVSGSLDIGSVSVSSNKTIIGADMNSTLTGNLLLSGVTNVIIQNLNITNPSGIGSADGIEASNGCSKIFVHKCTFIDCADGSFDIKRGTTDVTVSWCRFKYPTQNTHCYVNLIGHSDNNGSQDRGNLHVTMHHNWYDNGCQQRMPRVRFGQVHVYNNFYGCPPTDPEVDYTIGVGVESSILVQNSYFEDIANTWWNWKNDGIQGEIEWHDLCLINTELSTWAPNSDVFDPPYTYSLQSACEMKDLLTNAEYGAGNTPENPDQPTNINFTYKDKGIEILPNPAVNYIKIKGLNTRAQLTIIDLSGKLIKTKEISDNETIAIDALSQGIYIVKITSDRGTTIEKFIKN